MHFLRFDSDDTLLMQEQNLRRTCQEMSCRLFAFYRDIVQTQARVSEAQVDCAKTSNDDHEIISRVMASLNSMCEPWVERSLDQFAQLSPASQLSFGMLKRMVRLFLNRFLTLSRLSYGLLEPRSVQGLRNSPINDESGGHSLHQSLDISTCMS